MKATCFCAFMILSLLHTFGQEVGHGRVWKKKVSRVVNLKDGYGNSGLNNYANTKELAEIIADAVQTNKIQAYKRWGDQLFSNDRFDIFSPKYDTLKVVTKKDTPEIRHMYFLPDSIYQYRVVENWTFYPDEGRITIQIEGVEPLRRIWDTGWSGYEISYFKLKYEDIILLLGQNENATISNIFIAPIWNSYFTNTSKIIDHNNKFISGIANTEIDLFSEPDTMQHFLRNESWDTVLSKLIVNNVKNNYISAWAIDSKQPFHTLLTNKHLSQLIKDHSDTIDGKADENGLSLTKIITLDFNFENIHKYKILEEWKFDASRGITDIFFTGIALMLDEWGHDGPHHFSNVDFQEKLPLDDWKLKEIKPLFWIRYSDLLPILDRIEQYHPDNTFAIHIWNQIFLTDIKPILQQ